MDTLLLTGTIVGGVIGLLHAAQFIHMRVTVDRASWGSALWHGIWICALWTLFGAYLLIFWLIGLAGMTLASLTGRRRSFR